MPPVQRITTKHTQKYGALIAFSVRLASVGQAELAPIILYRMENTLFFTFIAGNWNQKRFESSLCTVVHLHIFMHFQAAIPYLTITK